MSYPTYLVHFNKNHDKRNGQFTYGDGDGDGISNDHAHRSKDLYKSIQRDVRRGEFDPKKYKSNESINKAINDNKLVSKIKNRDRLLEEYNQQQKEQAFQQEVTDRLKSDTNKRAQKYYEEMLNGRDPSKLSSDERYDIFEKAMWKAQDEDSSNSKFLETRRLTDDLVDKNKIKNLSFQDVSNANLEAATAYDEAVEKILGDYSDKKILTLKSNDRAKEYVSSIIDEILLDENVKIRT